MSKIAGKDKIYRQLMAKAQPLTRNLYELSERDITPTVRKKLNLHGRPEETSAFSLRFKGDITGNPYDTGWILKDKQPTPAQGKE